MGARSRPGLSRAVVTLASALVAASGLVALPPAPPAAAVATATVAFWSLDEPSGATGLSDSSGQGRHGTIGSDVTSGVVVEGATAHRFATHLPGFQQEYPGHVNRVAHHSSLNPDAGDFSITVRLRTDYRFGNIMQKGQGATTGGYWKLENPEGKPRCLFRGGNGASRTGYSTVDISDGQWHTIHCNRTSTFVEMYVDGVRTSRLNGATGTIANSWGLTLGGKGTCDGVTVTCDYFVGDIDYVRIEKGSGGPPNVPPVAAQDLSCTGLICTASGSASTDSDGAIQSYVWDFGDGTVVDRASVSSATHTYAQAGDYDVTLTVTDDRGDTDSAMEQVSVAPVPEVISFAGSSTSNANVVNHAVTLPASVQEGDTLLLFLSQNNQATSTGPTGVAGWTQLGTQQGGYGRTTVWSAAAGTSDAGAVVTVPLSQRAKGNLVVAAYRGVDPDDPVAALSQATDSTATAARTTPFAAVSASQGWGVSYWMHGDSTSMSMAPPAGVTVRSNSSQSGGGRVTGLLADTAASVPQGSYGGLTATGSSASTTTTTWTLVLTAGGP